MALVLARYYMFTQVYFHKTRVAYDHHIREALKAILLEGAPGGTFPPPTPEAIRGYLRWDDWSVLGRIAEGGGGEHGGRLRERNHYREVYHTPESAEDADQSTLRLIRHSLGDLVAATESSKTSAYKLEASEISVVTDDAARRVRTLSHHSTAVKNLKPINAIRLYARPEHAADARAQIACLLGNGL